jgi:quinoprotein relay system zinc metallohydrolase 2
MLNLLIILQLFLLSSFAWAEPLPIEEIAPGVFVHHGIHEEMDTGYHGDICNIGFIVGKSGVAVIDSGGSFKVGQQLREAIRKVTDLPIKYVINTHVHPDHIFGNAAFKADHPVYVGHAKLAEAMERRKEIYLRNNTQWMGEAFAGSEMIKPTQAVDTTLELDLGNRMLLLTAWPPAHTHADLSVFDRETASLWTGDLLFIERTPSMDGDTLSWLKLIPQLREIPAKRAVPGHGPVSEAWRAALDNQQRYFETLLADIRQDIRKGVTMESAMDSAAASEKGNWVLFDTVNRRNVNILYPQLEWE